MDTNTFAYFMVFLTIGLTFIAFRTNFWGVKSLVGLWWFVLLIYFRTTPPAGLVAGSTLDGAILLMCAGFGITLILMAAGSSKQKSFSNRDGSQVTTSSFSLHRPGFLGGNRPKPYHETAEDYRARVHQSLHPRSVKR